MSDVHSIRVTGRELKRRRAEILAEVGWTLAELAFLADSYRLVGQEHAAWEEIEEIQFLLGEL